MKQILAFLLTVLTHPSLFALDCHIVDQQGEAIRWDCNAEGKTFHVLKLKGNFSKISVQHARLMSKEVIQGPLGEVIESLRTDLSKGSLAVRQFKQAVFDCYSSRIENSVSREFLDASRQFSKAVIDSYPGKSPFTQEEINLAQIAIELSIVAEGLAKLTEDDPLGTIAELGAVCGITLSLDLIDEVLSGFKQLSKMKLGCLGFVSPGQNNLNGQLMHARNFDANLVASWNRHPTLFLVEEPGYYKYAAVASAGVTYAGGISGINEHGLSVSLHEMSTTHYRTSHSQRSAEITPFLQQRLLREARTLDEALAIIQRTKAFGAWTILISDSKSNESASVEISGDRTQVARRSHGSFLGQSNHFLGSRMGDQFFTYSFGKSLESDSRLKVIERELRRSAGKIDLMWMIDHLAGHEDAFEGRRAFGRTAVKAYNVLSTVAIPGLQQFWFSIGNKRPAAHSDFAGFQINFANMTFQTLDTLRTQQFNATPNWERSLETYVNARLLYEANQKRASLGMLEQALRDAQTDGIDETTYRYILGRLLLELDRPLEALRHFENLHQRRTSLHTYQVALISLYAAVAHQRLSSPQTQLAQSKARFAEEIFRHLQKSKSHFDLAAKIKLASKVRKGSIALSDLPVIDFVTVE